MTNLNRNRKMFASVFLSALQQELYVDVPVYGLSMFPFYKPGDLVRVVNVDMENPTVGDVVVFTQNNKLIAHRLLKVHKEYNQVVTKGDGLVYKDKRVFLNDVHAVVICHFRNGKELYWVNKKAVKKMIRFVSPIMGWVFFIWARVWNKFLNTK